MKLRFHTVREYVNAMLNLLPPGAAWRWPVDGLGDKIFQAFAAELVRIEQICQQVLDRAIALHVPTSGKYTLADYQAVADAAAAQFSESLPRQASRAGRMRAGQRLWSSAAEGSTWPITKVKLTHLQGPSIAGKLRAGQRLMGARSRFVIRVWYYAGVVDPDVIATALLAFKQAHVVLFLKTSLPTRGINTMFRIDGPGNNAGHFVDEDPLNEIPGTQVTAEWLEMVQEEKINVVLAAGMTLDKEDNGQLLKAIRKLTIDYYPSGSALPSTDNGPIWHADYNSIMTWQVFNANGADYTGYASLLIGNMLFDTQPTPRPGYFKTGTANLSRVTYAAVRAWAKHHGRFVADNVWAAGDIVICDNADGNTFKAYDLRAQFPRLWDDNLGVDSGRAFGSRQAASLIATAIGPDALHNLVVEGATNNTATVAEFNAAMSTDIINDADYSSSLKGLSVVSATGSYPGNSSSITPSANLARPVNNSTATTVGGSRPRNTAFAGMIKF